MIQDLLDHRTSKEQTNPSWERIHWQGCALAEPGDPWRLPFALTRLENLYFFYTIICWTALDFTVSEDWAPFNFP